MDLSTLFQRVVHIDKLAEGGMRNQSVHLNSIKTDEESEIFGEVVLLMDDVTISHNSLEACKKILLEHGAEKVSMFALGQTVD